MDTVIFDWCVAGPLSPSITTPINPIELNIQEQHDLGYMPFRDDFERVFTLSYYLTTFSEYLFRSPFRRVNCCIICYLSLYGLYLFSGFFSQEHDNEAETVISSLANNYDDDELDIGTVWIIDRKKYKWKLIFWVDKFG